MLDNNNNQKSIIMFKIIVFIFERFFMYPLRIIYLRIYHHQLYLERQRYMKETI
jgi:hypothetical protein